MNPFNLGKALAGEPFGTKECVQPEQWHYFDKAFDCVYPLVCVFDGCMQTYTMRGTLFNEGASEDDLVMLPVKKIWYFASWASPNACIRTSTRLYESAEEMQRSLGESFLALPSYREHTIEIEE